MNNIKRVVGPLTGHSFYQARVHRGVVFARTRVEIERKVVMTYRYRTRVGGVVVEGETWAQFRAKLSEVVNHG
jgi:hypothetical protein